MVAKNLSEMEFPLRKNVYEKLLVIHRFASILHYLNPLKARIYQGNGTNAALSILEAGELGSRGSRSRSQSYRIKQRKGKLGKETKPS